MPIHQFRSADGEMLARWCEAFPGADCAHFDSDGRADLVWLRLPAGARPAETIARVRRHTDAPLVVLSDQPDDDEALACFAAAAKGYCNAHALPEVLGRVADVVLQGGLWIGESLMQRLLQGTARIPAAAAAPRPGWIDLLTERERQVALAVAAGSSNKEIARQLGITERTIKAHTGAIFEKLGVRDRLQLSLLVHGRDPGQVDRLPPCTSVQ